MVSDVDYSWFPITRTLANSNRSRFPLDILQTFTIILPSVTQTLDNSNLPLTRSNFWFPLPSITRTMSASFPVVLGDFGCDVTYQACRENSPRAIALGSKPPLVTRIARTGLGTRLEPCYKRVTSRDKKPCAELRNIEFISKQECQFFVLLGCHSSSNSVPILVY